MTRLTGCGAGDAMIKFSIPSRGQQVLTPLGFEQTTSFLVVLIARSHQLRCKKKPPPVMAGARKKVLKLKL